MMVGDSLADGSRLRGKLLRAGACWRRAIAAAVLSAFALSIGLVAPADAAKPPNAALNSTNSMLRWINAYRGRARA